MRITFLVFSFFTALVPSVFLLPRLGLKRRTQLLLSAGLFLIASRFWVNLVFTGSMFHPDWPAAVVCIWSVLDTVLSFFFFLQLPCYLFIRRISTLLASRSYNVKLQLSGHTHGGVFPGLAGFVARCNERNVRGLYRRGDLILYVSPGTGQWAGFPVRLFNPSEITVFTLKRSR